MANTETTISYPIFYPVKRFYWSPDAIKFASVGAAILVIVLPFHDRLSLVLRAIFASLFVTYFIYRSLILYSTRETLKGYIQGVVQLKPLEIILEDKTIPIAKIEKLTFNFFDYEGQQIGTSMFKSLNGQLSNGVKNSISIYFINGGERKIFIQRRKSDDIALIKPLLVEYCKRGLLTFHELTSLTCSSYKEVQELKAVYF